MELILEFLYQYSHIGVFLALLACGMGMPVPEDIILVTGGVIAAGNDSLLMMNAVGLAGVLLGDTIMYALGFFFGESIVKRRPFRWLVTPERLRKVRAYYRKYGYLAIFISRFLAGLRATSFLLAGLSRVPYRIFILTDGLAALISVPFFVCLGYYFSDNIEAVMARVKDVQQEVFLVGLPLLVVILVLRALWMRRKAREETAAPPVEESERGDASVGR